MNIIFSISIIGSFLVLIFINPSLAVNTMLSASEKAVTLCLGLISIYAVWLGILEIADKCGLNKKIAKLLSPIIRFLFGKQKSEINEQLAMNLSSNMFGMGNASTPCGMKAMQMLDDKSGKATKSMVMLMVINSMSIQIIPTTIIGFRVAYGSANATDVIFPILISSFVSTILGVLLVKLFYKDKKNKNFYKEKRR